MSDKVTERDLTCIVCPRGCALHVSTDKNGKVTVTGNTCARGATYGEAEVTHPVRTLTTTVLMADGSVLPVRTDKAIPKEMMFSVMREINNLCVCRPVTFGDVIEEDILHTGANLIATGIWPKND